MVTFAASLDAITSRVKTEVTDALTIPTSWPNAPFAFTEDAQWCDVQVLPGESFRATTGGTTSRYRTPGLLQIDVYTPSGEGAAAAMATADTIADAFRGVTASDIVYLTPSVEQRGRQDRWWLVSVRCAFRFDHDV